MRRWRDFAALGAYFGSEFLGTPRDPRRTVSSQRLLDAARAHWAVPTLSWCLRNDASVPPDLRSYLDAVLRLNGKRNKRLHDALLEIVGALNSIDVEPTLLKGAAYLVGKIYPSPAARLLNDLDILIPAARGPEAVAAMEKLGYYVDQFLPDWHRHLPFMRHADTDIVLELHTKVVPDEFETIVPVPWFSERTKSVDAWSGLRARIPDATALIAHNVAHDQIINFNYKANFVELRQLLDVAVIRARDDEFVDWPEIERRFASGGAGSVLATYTRYAEVLFGQPMPALASRPRPFAISRLRWASGDPQTIREARQVRRQQRARRIATLVRESLRSAGMVLSEPRRLVRLLDPRAWLRLGRSLRRAAKETM